MPMQNASQFLIYIYKLLQYVIPLYAVAIFTHRKFISQIAGNLCKIANKKPGGSAI